MNTIPTTLRRTAGVIAIGAAVALAGCGPKIPVAPTTGMAAPNQMVGQPVPPAPGSYPVTSNPPTATAPAYAQAPVQTAQVQQQYPQQYAQAPQYPQPQPQQQQQYAPPPQYAQPQPQAQYAPPPPPRHVASAVLGEVEHIEPIRTRPQGSGAGAVIGGVLGAVVGNQFGHGSGRTAMTVLGAGGGAVAGNNIERNRNEGIAGYRVTVRMDNGVVHVYEPSNLDGLRIGDRVSVSGGRVHRV